MRARELCGSALDASDVIVKLEAPSSFLEPQTGMPITRTTPFSWRGSTDANYVLRLETEYPSALRPNVDVYTRDTTATWPDLGSAPIEFPAGAPYRCSIGGFAPFRDIDELVGPDGLGAVIPHQLRISYSQSLSVVTSP